MKSESKLILELWDHFRDHIGPNKRTEVLVNMFRVLEDYGIEPSKADLEGEDANIDEALNLLFDEDESLDEDYDDYDYD